MEDLALKRNKRFVSLCNNISSGIPINHTNTSVGVFSSSLYSTVWNITGKTVNVVSSPRLSCQRHRIPPRF